MNGGLLKSASRVALLAAAGLFVGGVAMPSAKAADLGGDCCADLEERVAELEATTARKGNRRMSLTVTGQVNRGVLFWDDGHKSDVYYGLDSTNSSSRFTFLGEAKITGAVKAGFEIMIEIEAGGTSSKVSQFNEDGQGRRQSPVGNRVSFNAGNVDAYMGDARRVLWWIEHKDVGRLTVGRMESAGVGRHHRPRRHQRRRELLGHPAQRQLPHPLDGPVTTTAAWLGGAGRSGRRDRAAPSWCAMTARPLPASSASASIGEAGDYWGAMLRYAGEFSGVRIAAGIGYEKASDRATSTTAGPARPSV